MRIYRGADWMSTPPLLVEPTTTLANAQLQRCENCRYLDKIACLLDRAERHEAIPGQYRAAFGYLPMRAASVGAAARDAQTSSYTW